MPGRNAGYPDAALARRRELSRRDYDVPVRHGYRVSASIIVIVLVVIVIPIIPPFVPVIVSRSGERIQEKGE